MCHPCRPARCAVFAGLLLLGVLPPGERSAARDADRPVTPDARVREELHDFYPLNVGAKWHYSLGENKFTTAATRRERVAGLDSVRMEMLSADGRAMAHEHLALKHDGVYRVAFEGKTADPAVKVIAFHVRPGDQWKVETKVGNETLRGTFVSGRERIKVGATTYDCATATAKDLNANGQKITFKYYYARGVGMVRQEVIVGGQVVVITLDKYEPAP